MPFQQGDIIWLNFDSQAGYKEGKRRPAIIVSGNDALAFIRTLALVCPITSGSRPFPTHIPLDDRTKTKGLILCEQVKALDLDAQNAVFVEKAPEKIVADAVNIIHSMLD